MRISTRRARRAISRAKPRLPRLLRIFSQAWPTNTLSRPWRPSLGTIVSIPSSKATPNLSSKRDITPARTAEITVLTVRPTRQTLQTAPHTDNRPLSDTLLPYLTGILCPQCKMILNLRKCMMRLNSTPLRARAAMNLMAPTRRRRSRGHLPAQLRGAARVLSTLSCALRLRSKLSSEGRSISSSRWQRSSSPSRMKCILNRPLARMPLRYPRPLKPSRRRTEHPSPSFDFNTLAYLYI